MSDLFVKQNADGRWEVRWDDGPTGFCCFYDFFTEAEAEAWRDGYDQGARENM